MQTLALALALMLLSCEANPPQHYIASEVVDTTDAYGDSEPACTVLVDPSVADAAKACLNLGPQYVSLDGKCFTGSQAWKACKAKTDLACYRPKAGACVLCLQLDGVP